MTTDRTTSIAALRRSINLAALGAVFGAMSVAGWLVRPQAPGHQPVSGFLVFAGFAVVVIGIVVIRGRVIRLLTRPRCSVCGSNVSVDPNWKMDRAQKCQQCGHTVVVVGRP